MSDSAALSVLATAGFEKSRQLKRENNALIKEVERLTYNPSMISLNLFGIEIGKPLEGIDEDGTDLSMVYSFVEGEIDKQAYRADKAEQERDQLREENKYLTNKIAAISK